MILGTKNGGNSGNKYLLVTSDDHDHASFVGTTGTAKPL